MEEPPLDRAARQLVNHLVGAVQRQLHYADAIALAFSGGLDSSVLARLLADQSDVTVFLVTATRPGALDTERARRVARHLRLPLVEVVVGRARFEEQLPALARLVGLSRVPDSLAREWKQSPRLERVNPVHVGMLAPLYFAAHEARLHAARVLVGQGADELFAGYERYSTLPASDLQASLDEDFQSYEREVRPIEDRIAQSAQVQFRYPYLDKGVVPWARALPPAFKVGPDGSRKVILRRAAELLGLPDDVVRVPKTAAQYGSGIADYLRELAEAAGSPQTHFLTQFVPAGAAPAAPEPAAGLQKEAKLID